MHTFEFEHPWFFLLLIPLIQLVILAWKRKDPSLCVPSLTPYRLAAGKKKVFDWRKFIPLFCMTAAGIFLIAGMARPRTGLELIRSRTDGIDIMLAVDLSGSMHAMDIPKNYTQAHLNRALQRKELKNRLEVSKQEIAKFIGMRTNDRIGLIAFAERPYVICPPTLDHAFLLANLFRLEPGMIGDGTGIAGPVTSGVKRLKDRDSRSRILVLFTDGANTVPMQVTPLEAAKLADTFDITLYTVGIGSGNAVMEQQTPFGTRHFPYTDQYDEKLLKDMASGTGGKYYHADDAEGLAQAMKEIDQLEKTSSEQQIMIRWKEYYPVMAWCAVAALLLGMLSRSTICMKYP